MPCFRRRLIEDGVFEFDRLSGEFQGTFDRIFDCPTTQDEVFDEVAAPAVRDVLKGYNGTILAYGQVP